VDWNAELIREQLYQELITATVWLLNPSDVAPEMIASHREHETVSEDTNRDPTMPQFRPNSSVDLVLSGNEEVAGGSQQSTTASELGQ
nr:hypothetical protein [Tanacetum cinerariifolium]